MYFATASSADGQLHALTMTPMQIRNFRPQRASAGDAEWLCGLLCREGEPFGTGTTLAPDGTLSLHRRQKA